MRYASKLSKLSCDFLRAVCKSPKSLKRVFIQRPKGKVSTSEDVWYDDMESVHLARNGRIYCEKQNFPSAAKPFNQASAVTVLDKSGFEERHIMAARGHKKEPSIRSYSKTNICTKTKLSETLTTRFEVSVELSVMISHHSCPVLSISQEGVIKNSCRSEITKNVYFFNHNANLQNIFDVFKLFPLRAFQELFPYDIDFP